jgi:hypothetical protein
MIHSPGWEWSKRNGVYNYTIPAKGSLWNLANGDFILRSGQNAYIEFKNGELKIAADSIN